MPAATLNGVSSAGDFESTLDYVSTVGYDVAFLRGDVRRVLADNPVAESEGAEHFDPRVAPLGALRARGPWATRLLQGGGTFLDELAGTTTWAGSLDLPDSARRVAELTRQWMAEELPAEADMIARAPADRFPKRAPASEQFYSLRDAIQFLEQWLPGSPAGRPALLLLIAFCIGVDEFLLPVASLETSVYLGRRIGDLWDECAAECGGGDDAAQWLALARDALHSSVFLQNREKLAYMGLVHKDKEVFRDWDTTAHYMLRAETAMTPFVGFCLCAYAGLPFRPDLAGAVGVYCYGNALVLDFCKRATRLGAGSYTEVALADKSGELQGRAHLIGAIMDYGESVLPQMFLCVLRPFVIASSSTVDVQDRYRERSWGLRLPVSKATLCMMTAVMEGARGSLTDSGASSVPESVPSCMSGLVAELVDMLDARDMYAAYLAHPSADAWYRLPRLVRLALKMGEKPASSPPTPQHDDDAARKGSRKAPQPERWMTLLATACASALPSAPAKNAAAERGTSRLGAVRALDLADELQSLALRSPARPGGYAAGRREFTGRPVGSGSRV